MVRFGEYSPNNPDYLGASNGILGLGEYEEKRRYYDEQRKLEYKQYLAKQALKLSSVKGKGSKLKKPVINETQNLIENHKSNTSVQKHTSTQTERSQSKDVSTNTETNTIPSTSQQKKQYISLEENGFCSPNLSNPKINNSNSLSSYRSLSTEPTNSYDKRKEERLLKLPSDVVEGGVLKDPVCQDTKDSMTFGMETKSERRRWHDNAVTYERDLRAQVEERQRLKSEMKEKERQEELARERWVVEEGERVMSRQREEGEKAKAREDLRKQRMEEFCRCQEELKKEAEGKREVEARRRVLEYQNGISAVDSNFGRVKHSPKEMLFNQPIQESMRSPKKSLNSPLLPVQESDMFRNFYSPREKGSRERGSKAGVSDATARVEENWQLTPVKRTNATQVSLGTPSTIRDHQSNNAKKSASKPASARTPKNNPLPSDAEGPKLTALADSMGKDVHRVEEKLPRDSNVFAQLGEIRRQLKMEQGRMEDAIRRKRTEL